MAPSSYPRGCWDDKEFRKLYSRKLNEHVKRIPIINITSQKRSDIKDLVNELYDKLCMCMHEAVRDVTGDAKEHGKSSKTKRS